MDILEFLGCKTKIEDIDAILLVKFWEEDDSFRFQKIEIRDGIRELVAALEPGRKKTLFQAAGSTHKYNLIFKSQGKEVARSTVVCGAINNGRWFFWVELKNKETTSILDEKLVGVEIEKPTLDDLLID